MEHEVHDESHPASQRLEYCKWLAECNKRLEDYQETGNWYLEAVKVVLSENIEPRAKAKEGLPLCNSALEAFEKGGDPSDVLVAARVKQYLFGLSR